MASVLQAAPKSCGHVRGKRVVARGEAVARIRAAADARDESGSNIVIVARTDARQAETLQVCNPCALCLHLSPFHAVLCEGKTSEGSA